MIEIIFYFGNTVIIILFIGLLNKKFKEEDHIDLQEHKWIIFLYMFLLIFAIITWRIVYLFSISNTQEIINYNINLQKAING